MRTTCAICRPTDTKNNRRWEKNLIKFKMILLDTPKRLLKPPPKINKGFTEKILDEKKGYRPSSKDNKLCKLKFKQFTGKFDLVARPKPTTLKF